MKRRSVWLAVTAVAAALGITLAAVPEARAQVARLFGWNSYEVTEQPGAQITWDRKPTAPEPGSKLNPPEQKTVHTVAEARAQLPEGVTLPPALEGQEMLITRITDQAKAVVAVDLAAPNVGFWARYRASGQHDQVHTSYGADFTVTTEARTIGGRPFEIITGTMAGGKSLVTIWGEDGAWMYEVQGYGRDLDRMMEMLETMN